MMIKILLTVGIIAGAILARILTTTTPNDAGAIGVLVVFLLIYIVTVSFLALAVLLVHRISLRVMNGDRMGVPASRLSPRKAYYYSSIVSLAPVIVISLRSVGQLNIVSILLLLVFIAVGLLYVAKQAE